jgi:HK97 family phage major capsid protein|nr:MAG TPA: major capsid protein [Caudoviricetes sp.]
MTVREYLNNLITRNKKQMEKLRKKLDESTDVNEVRSLGATLAEIRDEINEAEEQLKNLDDGDNNDGDNNDGNNNNGDNNDGENRNNNPDARHKVINGEVRGSFGIKNGQPQKREEDPSDSVEYRTAFMNFICRNVPISAELREATNTVDASAVIPKTIVNEIVKKLESYGNIFAKVRKLNVQGGVSIPINDLKPTAKWIDETTASEDQKLQANSSVTFSYFGVECKLAQSLLVNITTLDVFQKEFINLATEAIVKAVEIAIFNGTGTNQPLGIVKDSRVKNIVTLSTVDFGTWEGWHKVKGKIKKAYRNGCFVMNQSTFDGNIDGMVDKNGQPIARVNYGIDSEEKYRFMGKEVETVEDDILPAYEDAKTGDVVAVFINLSDYAINTNMDMTATKWVDNDTNKIKNKVMMIIDGKLIDTNGVVLIKKGE